MRKTLRTYVQEDDTITEQREKLFGMLWNQVRSDHHSANASTDDDQYRGVKDGMALATPTIYCKMKMVQSFVSCNVLDLTQERTRLAGHRTLPC